MQYTYMSLVLVWLVIAALVALASSGLLAGQWRLLLVAGALAAPALLRSSSRESKDGPSREDVGERGSPADPRSTEVHRWENEGGAPRLAA